MTNPPEKKLKEIVVMKEPEVPVLEFVRALRRSEVIQPVPKIGGVPSGVRRSHALRRKAALEPAVDERRKRQKRSRQQLKKATTKPSSGHKSPRPGRHSTKLKEHLESIHA